MFGTANLMPRDLDPRVAVADRVHQPRGLHHEQPRHLELDPRLGDPVADVGVLGDRLAERLARVGPCAHQLERPLGRPDRPHAVVDPTRTEPGLGDHEAHPLAGDDVLGRDAHVGERRARRGPRCRDSRTPAGCARPSPPVCRSGRAPSTAARRWAPPGRSCPSRSGSAGSGAARWSSTTCAR